MEYGEFKRRLGKASLTIAEFAKLVKVNPKSISNYSKLGQVPSHHAVIVTLMAEMAERGIAFRAALEELEMSDKKPRGGGRGHFGGDKQINLF